MTHGQQNCRLPQSYDISDETAMAMKSFLSKARALDSAVAPKTSGTNEQRHLGSIRPGIRLPSRPAPSLLFHLSKPEIGHVGKKS